jgi:hypothetical protein
MNPIVTAIFETPHLDPQIPLDLFTLARRQACVAALAAVHPELVAVPADDVFAPGGRVTHTIQRALARVREERASTDRVGRTTHLEQLALAFLRTHHEIAWPETLEVLSDYDRLVVYAERRFKELDHLVAHLVYRGKIARGSLPRCARTTFADRCERAILCVALLRDHGVFHVRLDLRATKAIARRLLHARPKMPGELSPTETRDRAYTALCHAMSEPWRAARRTACLTESGVFAIEEPSGAVAHARSA